MSQNQHTGAQWKLIIASITLAGVIVTAVCGVLNGPATAEIVKYWLYGAPTTVAVSTYASTVTLTLSPTPHKRLNTLTPTPTVTITSTSTPTNIPLLADTPTPTPTGTPIPPDAVVKAEALNLRSGPGVVYDVLEVLKQGDCLKVIGMDLAGDWLKVIAPGGQEGWVARSLLQVNVDMGGVAVAQPPPTPTLMPTPTATPTPKLLPPPILIAPENGAAFLGEPPLLRWQWVRPLEPDEVFSVRVHREGETSFCHLDKTKDLEYRGSLSYCTAGTHYWGVALARKLCGDETDNLCWQTLSEESAERWFYYVPAEEPWTWPTPAPSGGGGGGDDGDDGGSFVPGG